MGDPINVFYCFIGIMVSPSLTLCVILWSLGHPILGVMALLTANKVTRDYVKMKIVDIKTGKEIIY